jgi:hypothetical protein
MPVSILAMASIPAVALTALMLWALSVIVRKIRRRQPIGMLEVMMAGLWLLGLETGVSMLATVWAGLSHSQAAKAQLPAIYITSFLAIVVTPAIGLLIVRKRANRNVDQHAGGRTMMKLASDTTITITRTALLLAALSATLTCGKAQMQYRGTIVSTKLGYALQAGDSLYYLEGSADIERFAGRKVAVTGALSQREDLPAFVMTPGMKQGKEPIPQGIPVESEGELAKSKIRRVIAVTAIRPLD